jgi:hypothetical protein
MMVLPPVPCEYCGKLFPQKRTKFGMKRFCSRECTDHWQRARVNPIREQVAAMAAENIPPTEIAHRLGVTKNVVVGLRRRMGLPRYQRPKPEPRSFAKASYLQRRHLMTDVAVERLALGADPLPPMHPISWGAIAL